MPSSVEHQRSAASTARSQAFLAAKREASEDVDAAVRDIIAQVRARRRCGADRADAAVRPPRSRQGRHPRQRGRDRGGRGGVRPGDAAALELARARIESHHRRQLPRDDRYTDALGAELGSRWTAVESVGLYVPGGLASYPSSVLMNAVPAKVAGVPRVAMVVPSPGGEMNPLVLAAAHLAGVSEIYRIGGAQAVAALAYGTETIATGRQDRRPRQRLRRRRQAAGVRHGRHRLHRRAVRSARHRRQGTTIPNGSPPTCWPRPSTTPPRRRS